MTNQFSSRKGSLAILVGGSLAAVAVLGACSSGTHGSSSTPAPPASGGGSSTVDVHTVNGTSFLTDSAGRSLYLFGSDTKTKSTCSGSCATAWPPLTVKGAPTAGAGATAADLATISRSDGSKQVTYAGHPLYYFAGDKTAGQINGEGSTAFGAPWYVVAPTGQQITSVSAPSAPSGGGGGGY